MVPCLSAGRLVSQRAQTSYKEKVNTPFFIDFSAGAKGLRVGRCDGHRFNQASACAAHV